MDLQPYLSPTPQLDQLTSRSSRSTSRALSRLSEQTTLGIAHTQARAELEASRVDAVAAVAGRALQDVALLSQMEQSLAQTVPHASGRLALVADLAAMALADHVTTAARRIGR